MSLRPSLVSMALVATLLLPSMQARSSDPQKVGRESSSTPSPTTCAELFALGDAHVDLSNREISALKQRCHEEDIRAKFAALDQDSDGYLIRQDMPADHMLGKLGSMPFSVDESSSRTCYGRLVG